MTDLTITIVSPNRALIVRIAREVATYVQENTDAYIDLSISAEEENTEKPEEPATQPKVNKGGE